MHVGKFYNDKLRNSKHTHSTETIRISHINQVSEASVSQCSEWTMQGNNRTGVIKKYSKNHCPQSKKTIIDILAGRRWTSAQEQEWGFPKYENYKRNIRQNSNLRSHVIS